MLTLWGPGEHTRYCDGRSRRSFLKIGGLAMGGLSLPGLLQAETRGAAAGSDVAGSPHKSVIMIYLSGGLAAPGHLRPEARGARRDPRRVQADRDPAARRPDRRTAAADRRRHGQGRRDPLDRRPARRALELPERHRLPDGPEPARGQAQLRLGDRPDAGPVDPVVPPFIDLFPIMQHKPYNSPGPGFLGHPYKPARMEGDDLAL